MAKTYHDADADLSLIQAKKSPSSATARRATPTRSTSRTPALTSASASAPTRPTPSGRAKAGLVVGTVAKVSKWADVIMNLTPDQTAAKVYHAEIEPNLKPRQDPHVRARLQHPLPHHHAARRRSMSRSSPPRRPGHRVREVFTEGGGVPGLVAVEQDASGHALALALSYAKGIGCTRAGVLETTFTEETETDLFGEQAVLCGGTVALVKAGFETLVEAGYQPELAYFEVLHELKLIVDLMYRGGLEYMRHSISDTAEWGDYVAGPRIVTPEVKKAMKSLLNDIQDGSFAKKFIEENETGRHEFARIRKAEAAAPDRKSRRRTSQVHAFPRPCRRQRWPGPQGVNPNVTER